MAPTLLQCLGPTYTGDFHLRGADLRQKGLNRVGNLLVPNSNYCAFEDWIMPILDAVKREQDTEGARWTPSKVSCSPLPYILIQGASCNLQLAADRLLHICCHNSAYHLQKHCTVPFPCKDVCSYDLWCNSELVRPLWPPCGIYHVQWHVQVVARLGKEVNDERSVCYWAWKNGIPIFCPALTDGSIGDMLFFHSYKSPGLIIDIVDDIRQMNDSAMKAAPRKTGIIILGGGECAECLTVVSLDLSA